MKKSLIFAAAASALMLTACSSENDVVQTATQPQPVVQQAVGFDIYTPAATNVTRAGLEGTMTTGRMQRSEANGGGFGVYAYLTEDINGTAGTKESDAQATAYSSVAPNIPNFMVNEKVLWNSTSLGWYYDPLKYWPNETDKDSQTSPASMEGASPVHLDRLTFFAYAPYVPGDAGTTGITNITDKTGKLNTKNVPDPTIAWKATTSDTDFNPDEGVDLLWGVAPSGDLSYTAVNGWTVTRTQGTPLLNMIKPDVNTNMKFLFQHALARFGVTVSAAIDQVPAGGPELDPNTKITINSFKITGLFGTKGELNLNNGTADVANWTEIQNTSVVDGKKKTTSEQTITLTGTNATSAIAPNLRWTGPHNAPVAQTVVGVTTAKQDLLRPSNKWYNKLASKPAYSPAKKYYTYDGSAYIEAHATKTVDGSEGYYEKSGNNYNKKSSGTITSPNYPEALSTDYFTITETSKANPTKIAASGQPGTVKLYTKDGSGNYIYEGTKDEVKASLSGDWANNTTKTYYTIQETTLPLTGIAFTYPDGTYYQAERNYLYVVPTNNYIAANTTTPLGDNDKLKLRTITVQIEYYITTEDSKLNAGRAQTKNVITKEVVLPNLANGKSYNLNVVLGLTSVKIDAEVDDWKVVNSQVDLPQNTAGE